MSATALRRAVLAMALGGGAASVVEAATPTGTGAAPDARRVPPDAAPAFVVIDVEITDPARFGDYVRGHIPTLTAAGGRFLAAGGPTDTVEGEWSPRRLIIHQWPSAGAFYAWYDGEAYRPWKALRHSASRANVVLVGGVR